MAGLNFGFLSPYLKRQSWYQFPSFLPDAWRYWRGPKVVGQILGEFADAQMTSGYGWQIPPHPEMLWNKTKQEQIWRNFLGELQKEQIKILGIEQGSFFDPPLTLRNNHGFPGISDGKALELLIFINRLHLILRSYGITSQKAKATIIWEEGNLGMICARLVAEQVRFLTLINPSIILLERAAGQIIAESGISPQVNTELASGMRGARLVIICGRLIKYAEVFEQPRLIRCEIFGNRPSLISMNFRLPLTIKHQQERLPFYPALTEAILRSAFNLEHGYWSGNELAVERVLKIGLFLKKLGLESRI